MSYFQRTLPLILLVASAVAQFDDFGGYDGYHKAQVQLHHQQSLDDHHGEEYDLDYHVSSNGQNERITLSLKGYRNISWELCLTLPKVHKFKKSVIN